MTLVLLIVVLVGLTIALLIGGLYTVSMQQKKTLANRVNTYVEIEKEAAELTADELQHSLDKTSSLNPFLGAHYMDQVAKDLAEADVLLRPKEYLLLRFGLGVLGFVVGYFVLGYIHSAVILSLAGIVAPMLFLRYRYNQRRAKFARQLADALMLLISSLRSGYSFLKGLELVAVEMEDPIAKELKRVLREVNLGNTVDQALLNLAGRVNNPDLEIVVSAYLVQRDVGGNLTELMEKVAETIRERLRLQGDIRALTAQGRLSGMVVGMLPFAIFGLILVINPGYFLIMLEPPALHMLGLNVPLGIILLGVAVVLQIIGVFLINRIISIKV